MQRQALDIPHIPMCLANIHSEFSSSEAIYFHPTHIPFFATTQLQQAIEEPPQQITPPSGQHYPR